MIVGKADKVLEEIEKVAAQVHLPIIGREKGSVLERLVKKMQPKLVLEVGTLVGYSTILMAKHLKNGKIITIELIKKNHEAAKVNIERAGLSKKVRLLQGDALGIIPTLEGPFDFMFIDAEKGEYLKYLKAAEPKLTKHAIIVADNAKLLANKMADYLDYVRKGGGYKSELHDFGFDGVEVSRKIK